VVLSISDLSLSGSLVGPFEVVVTAFAYAIFSVLGKPLVQKYGALHVAIWAGVLGTVMILPLLSQSFFTQMSSLSLDGWASVLYLSLLSTVLGLFRILHACKSRIARKAFDTALPDTNRERYRRSGPAWRKGDGVYHCRGRVHASCDRCCQ
jgi:hypothetical protein